YIAAQQLGVRVPEDLSLVTFHAGPCNTLGINISTWCVPAPEIGREAVEMLLERIDKKLETMPSRVLKFTEVTDGTTAAPA
ncbi:MAG: substrate-binding domain-containing protein, partial [Planctomycetota bacterium]